MPIGAVLTENEIVQMHHKSSYVANMVKAGVVYFDDVEFATNVQRLHDDWAGAQTQADREYKERSFLDLLGG